MVVRKETKNYEGTQGNEFDGLGRGIRLAERGRGLGGPKCLAEILNPLPRDIE